MALDNLARILRLNQIFKPNIPIESGWPGGPVVLKPNNDIGINEDWSWIRGGDKSARRANIGMDTLGQQPPQQSQQPQQPGIRDVLGALYTPDTTYSDMYTKTLGEMPQREKPSILRRIGAGIVGGGAGPKAGQEFLNEPYNEKLSDWETKMKFLQPGMQYERYANTNERSNAMQTASAILRERQLQQQADRDKAVQESRDEANKIRRIQALGGQFVVDDKTHKGYMLHKDGTKIDVDITKLSPADIEEAKQGNRLELEGERQENRVDLEKMREASAKDIANLRSDITMELTRQRYELMGNRDMEKFGTPVQAYDKEGKPLDYLVSINGKGEVRKIQLDQGTAIKPPPGAGKSGAVQSETQKAQGITNRARQVAAEFPGYSKFIIFDKTGKFSGIKKPSSWLPNTPDQQGYEDIYQKIYQEPFTAVPVKSKSGTTPPAKEAKPSTTPPKTEPSRTAPTTGKVRVKAPDGRTGTWDLSKGPIPAGFTEIK